jgi:Ca2+-binding EF-hand superfamily protein
VLQHLERKNNGVLDFAEFVRVATAKLDEDFTLPQTTVVFSGFDPKGNGKFNVYDLKDTVRDLGEDLTDDEI